MTGTIDSETTMREIGHIVQYGQTAYLKAVGLYVSTYWRRVIQSVKQTYKIMRFTSPPAASRQTMLDAVPQAVGE